MPVEPVGFAPVEPVGFAPVEPDDDAEPVAPDAVDVAPLEPVPLAGMRGSGWARLKGSVKARTVTSPAIRTKSRLSEPAETGSDPGHPSTVQISGASADREFGSAALELDFEPADHSSPFGAVPRALCSFVQEVLPVDGVRRLVDCFVAAGFRGPDDPEVEIPATVAAATAITDAAAVSPFSLRSL